MQRDVGDFQIVEMMGDLMNHVGHAWALQGEGK